jgi:UDP-N-acetylmuramoyl-L-alanyl-D-glutamate--2,6-diaminopimelate ligase
MPEALAVLDTIFPALDTARRRPLAGLLRAAGIATPPLASDPVVTGVTHDSRAVVPGDLFVAVRGVRDGADFAAGAVERGACAIVAASPDRHVGVPWIAVERDRQALADLASCFHGHPSRRLVTFGITGTSGKTTTAAAAARVLSAAGQAVGLVGTVEVSWRDRALPAARTTPEASDLQRYLADMAADGCAAAILEVSSQGIDLDRVRGVHFAAVAFTNLGQDHLDWHGSLDAYFLSKRRLFVELAPHAPAVIGADDERGQSLARELRALDATRVVVLTGFAAAADLRIEGFEGDAAGSSFRLVGRAQDARLPVDVDVAVRLAVPGRFNAQNAAMAAGLALATGGPEALLPEGLRRVRGVAGRLERVAFDDADQAPAVFVDYAHKPNALEGVLRAARALTRGRLICLFGCGGDRDREKRPAMGQVVGQLADVAVLTSDNPRSEDPRSIVDMALPGLSSGAAEIHVEIDRRKAIALALRLARPEDVVILAGKGHETYQEIAGLRLPFDDRIVAREERARSRN